MSNGYDLARRTLRTLDDDTPAVSLGDKRKYRVEGILLFSDEERDLLASVVGAERVMRQHGIDAAHRKQWYESWFGRGAILAALLGGMSEVINTVRQLAGH